MKKYLFLCFVFFPLVSFAVPSVRMLGNTSASTASAVKSNIVPVKSDNKNLSGSSLSGVARVGTLKAKNIKTTDKTQSISGSRFPAVVSPTSYTIVETPPQGENHTSTNTENTVTNDTGAIFDAVTQNISNYYYNKTEVYNKNEVYNKQEIDDKLDDIALDDPRFDAIRIVRGRYGSIPSDDDYPTDLPSNYIYMWIEEN